MENLYTLETLDIISKVTGKIYNCGWKNIVIFDNKQAVINEIENYINLTDGNIIDFQVTEYKKGNKYYIYDKIYTSYEEFKK